MLQPMWKRCLLVAALAVAGLTLSASPAQAGWRHWRGGCYSYGCNSGCVYTTSYCSPCVTSCGWSCCNPCWYPSCWSPYNSCWSPCNSCWSPYNSCWNPCYRSCYGVVSSCCGAVVVEDKGAVEPQEAPTPAPPAAGEAAPPAPAPEPASVLPPAPAPKAVPPAPDVDLPPLPAAPGAAPKPTTSRSLPRDAALLTVVVPEDARVYVNGMLTKTPGTQRQYVSYGLRPGYGYTYEVRAVVTRDGQELSDTQMVRVRVGETRDLAFDFRARADAVVAARLP